MQSIILAAGKRQTRPLPELQGCHEQPVVGGLGSFCSKMAAEVRNAGDFPQPEAGFFREFF